MNAATRLQHTVLELIKLTTNYLAGKGVSSPRLDAEVMLAHVLHLDRVGLYVNFERPLVPGEVAAYREMVARRGRREPLAYIIGEKEFMGKNFRVTPDVLIPRPETELLIEAVVKELDGGDGDGAGPGPGDEPERLRILDLGTGSGVIAVMLALLVPRARVAAVDISGEALAVARSNAVRHEVEDRITFLAGDLYEPLPPGEMFEVIVSNPPYIAVPEYSTLSLEVRREPQAALLAGEDGLAVIRQVIAGAPARLADDGLLAIEIGAAQGEAVRRLAQQYGFTSVIIGKDYAGFDRYALMRRRDSR
ncbi:MAG TPA: peptide chain release factor N(5)-glutamine methyltransferase [Firmicutes bacterium]|nr:peptide chain release factor N(5)-glutamine methyltransferase [Bacillota bacterium]